MTEASESICRRCGECCRIKYLHPQHGLVYMDFFCPALDLTTKLCRIYPERLALLTQLTGMLCLALDAAKTAGMMPSCCAYLDADAARQAGRYDADRVRLVPAHIRHTLYAEMQRHRRVIDYHLSRERCGACLLFGKQDGVCDLTGDTRGPTDVGCADFTDGKIERGDEEDSRGGTRRNAPTSHVAVSDDNTN